MNLSTKQKLNRLERIITGLRPGFVLQAQLNLLLDSFLDLRSDIIAKERRVAEVSK